MPVKKQVQQQRVTIGQWLLSALMSGIKRRLRFLIVLVVVAAVLAVLGYKQTPTITVAVPTVSAQPMDVGTSVPAASTSTPAPVSPYPVVHFTETTKSPPGVWPFTVQLSSITENPNGFTGAVSAPPQDTYLMAQVNITSQVTGRLVPPPDLAGMIVCQGYHKVAESEETSGYDQGTESAPERTGSNIAFSDDQPHAWDAEWVVSESTPVTDIKCTLGPDPSYRQLVPVWLQAVGPTALN
jgi:hypothetical protein